MSLIEWLYNSQPNLYRTRRGDFPHLARQRNDSYLCYNLAIFNTDAVLARHKVNKLIVDLFELKALIESSSQDIKLQDKLTIK